MLKKKTMWCVNCFNLFSKPNSIVCKKLRYCFEQKTLLFVKLFALLYRKRTLCCIRYHVLKAVCVSLIMQKASKTQQSHRLLRGFTKVTHTPCN